MTMAWHLIEKDGERQWIEAPARRAKGRDLPPEKYADAVLIEVRETPPDDAEGAAALAERDAGLWIERLPPGVLDLLADALADKVAARLTAVTHNRQERQD
jgi:hypothetical protein